jgi:hypothetical protein
VTFTKAGDGQWHEVAWNEPANVQLSILFEFKILFEAEGKRSGVEKQQNTDLSKIFSFDGVLILCKLRRFGKTYCLHIQSNQIVSVEAEGNLSATLQDVRHAVT